ncbi:MAG: molybdate ABC transporter substrate-binding protein [OCS116 cluster bacterium]|nr:molybdate ABC transporter substrate-binding protein [OCS116 cluster bacterium]
MTKNWIIKAIIGSFLAGILSTSTANAGEALMAVASNFAKPMQQLIVEFEVDSPHKISMTIGSSGKIYQQIRNAAPFDGFFSADQAKPLKLVQDGLAVNDSLYTYAIGQLVMWSPDVQKRRAKAVKGARPTIAIANPKTAPYGAAAIEVFKHTGVMSEFKAQLVYGENIAQAHQFIATGVAEFGFVALSQVMNEPEDSYDIVTEDMYSPIKQDFVLLKHGETNQAALDFLNFMRSKKAADIVKSLGYK